MPLSPPGRGSSKNEWEFSAIVPSHPVRVNVTPGTKQDTNARVDEPKPIQLVERFRWIDLVDLVGIEPTTSSMPFLIFDCN
jgi:hypothetical protein